MKYQAVKSTLLLFLLSILITESKLVTFSNVVPRLDSTGAVIKGHDGTTQRFHGTGPFYYHAMGYPPCNLTAAINGCDYKNGQKTCIYNKRNSLLVYSSPDLSSGSWRLTETVYPSDSSGFPTCTYFRSQAVYNPVTKLYVLWANTAGCDVNTCPNKKCGSYAVGTSTQPGHGFKFAAMVTPDTAAGQPLPQSVGDYALLVDRDGKGYILLTAMKSVDVRNMFIIQLTPDFLSVNGSASVGPLPGPKIVEAPAFFRRGEMYHALLGGCTCMGLYGGGVAALTAKHPLGPWTNITSALDPGCPMGAQSTCFQMGPGDVCNPITQAQQNYVIEVPLANGSSQHVWTGDRWQVSPDGKFDEQPQTWLPLSFDAGGELLPMKWVDHFDLDVAG